MPTKREPDILWHYCSIDTFKKICENKTLRFSDITKSNDEEEVKYIGKLYNCFANSHFTEKLIEYYNKYSSKIYCFCLSELRDNINMWDRYSKNGGFSIGFDFKKLEDFSKNIYLDINEPQDSSINLIKVEYENSVISDDLQHKFEEISNIARETGKLASGLLREIAGTYKNSFFESESEWRITFWNCIDICDFLTESLPIVVSNDKRSDVMFNSFYDLSFDFSMIKEVVICPFNNFLVSKDDYKKMVENFIKKNFGVETNIKVSFGNSNYRKGE